MTKILITGACGQLGSELTAELRRKHGDERVIASDIREPNPQVGDGPFENLDVMDEAALERVIDQHQITVIYHLAALLSASAEKNMDLAWKLNMDGLLNMLKLARDKNIERVFWPSSIAVFGPDAQKESTPQNSATNPATVYGITKVAGEQWGSYFYSKFGVDVRSLRYPGLIGYKSLPGGGTTDYAVDIYHKALAGDTFSCFLESDSALPMMYMADAVKAAIDLMEAPEDRIRVRTSYNVAAISFTPADIAESIKKVLPDFEIRYEPDYRQKIAASWPDSIDDSAARSDWEWSHQYTLDTMTEDILANLPSVIENA